MYICVSVPSVANITSYTVLERNGFIYMWHHAEGVEPYWTPPVIDEIAKGEWTYRGRTEHVVNCHIEVSQQTETICKQTLFSMKSRQIATIAILYSQPCCLLPDIVIIHTFGCSHCILYYSISKLLSKRFRIYYINVYLLCLFGNIDNLWSSKTDIPKFTQRNWACFPFCLINIGKTGPA